VKDLFAQYGQVGYVKIIEGKGFGFVEMASEADAIKAKEALNGFEFGGRKLKVDFATPKAPREQQ
jgi:RNA recognition motif-containing protein